MVVIRVVRVPEVVTLVDKIPADGFLRRLTRSSSDVDLDVDFTVTTEVEDRSEERRVFLPRHVGLISVNGSGGIFDLMSIRPQFGGMGLVGWERFVWPNPDFCLGRTVCPALRGIQWDLPLSEQR